MTATVDVPGTSDAVWAVVSDVARLGALADHVLGVSRTADGDRWRVLLNGSEVGWVQRERAQPPALLRFEQVSGDLGALSGEWRLQAARDGVRVTLEVTFDLGVDGLAPLLDPVWAQSFQVHADALVTAVATALRPPPAGDGS